MPDFCSVVGCSAKRGQTDGARFFRYPTKNKEQRQLWVQAVSRKKPDGNPWSPKKTSVVCSQHFIGGEPNASRNHPGINFCCMNSKLDQGFSTQ